MTALAHSRRRAVVLINQLGYGGSERQLYLLLNRLRDPELEIHVVVFNPSPNLVLNDPLRAAGVTLWEMPEKTRGIVARMLWLYRLLRRLRPGAVHSWNVHDNAYAGLVGLLARVPRRLGSIRGSLSSSGYAQLPAIFRWLCLHSVQRLVVNSRAVAAELADAGLPFRRVEVLRNCVDLATWQPAESSADLPRPDGDRKLVVSVGNLRRVKNHSMFIAAMGEVLAGFPQVDAWIVGQPVAGEPDVPSMLERQIEELGLAGRVSLVGFHPDVPGLLREVDVFCLCSLSEGMPNAILEAMAAARPIVATRVGGVPELIEDEESGLLVASDDAHGLAGAVSRLLRDPELAATLGAKAKGRIDAEYGCARAAKRLHELYVGENESRTTR